MKTRLRPVVLIWALVLQFGAVVYAQEPTSINELRQQIQKLTSIANDPKTDPEIKNLNLRFLDERRSKLVALLKEKLATLQSYQAKVSDVLSNDEKQVLAQAAQDFENEIVALENNSPTTRVFGSPVASQSGTSVSALWVNSASVPKGSSDFATSSDTTTLSASSSVTEPSSSVPDTGSSGITNAIVATTPASPAVGSAVPVAQVNDFNNWLNNRIEERIKAVAQARIDQNSNVNQTEAPSISDNSTSLVDQSSSSDLIGVALNLAGLGGGTNNANPDKNSAAVTATAYSLYSAFRGEQPLDPSFYNRHRNWRRLSFTLGFEKNQTDAQGQPVEDTTIAGAKFLIIAGRDAARNPKELTTVYQYLKAAAVSLARLNREIRDAVLFKDPALRNKLRIVEEVRAYANSPAASQVLAANRLQELQNLVTQPVEIWFDPEETDKARLNARKVILDFIENKYFDQAGLPLLLAALDEDALKQIDQLIDARLDAFTNLNNASRRAIEKIRRAPQFSLSFQSKQRKAGIDEYTGEAIFDYGVHDRVNLTLNGGYFYKNSRIIGGDLRGANFAGQLQFQMTPEKSLAGRSPLYFFLASEGNWASGVPFTYKLQGKVKVPLMDGIDFPISLTYANRTNLIDERDVRGQFGFTFDTAKLLRALLIR
jgi:hypothetical protein